MKILDRYIIRHFFINFAILLVVLMTLFITIDMLSDLDEFLKAGVYLAPRFHSTILATLYVLADYYGPLSILLYVFFSGLLVVAGMAFTFNGLGRTREVTAMVASGVSMYRVAAPVVVVGIALNALTLPAQEFILPALAQKLVRSKSQVRYEGIQSFTIRFAPDGQGNLLSAKDFNVAHQKLTDVRIIKRDAKGIATQRITAAQATWNPRRGGWNLAQGYAVPAPTPSGNASFNPTANTGPKPVSFFKTHLSPTILLTRRASNYPNFLPLSKLENLSRNKAVQPGERAQVTQIIWSRFSLLVLNVLILVMALPFFLLRTPGNMLVQAIKASGLILGAWGGGLVLLQVHTNLLNPVVSAWLPVVIYLPISAIMLQFMKT